MVKDNNIIFFSSLLLLDELIVYMSLSLEKLPVFYQLLLSEIDSSQQEKIQDKISNYALTTLEKTELSYYVHPDVHGKFTGVQALANTLLELRNDDQEFRSKAIGRYLSFKFALQLDLLNEWHKNEIYDFETDYYIYFNALSLMDEKNYQQALNTIEGIIQNQRYDFNTIQRSEPCEFKPFIRRWTDITKVFLF